MTESVVRLPYNNVTLEPGCVDRMAFTIDSTGVMPMPAAIAR